MNLKNPASFLILILIVAFFLRLYKLDNPVADWHSWRQADTAAVSRNFYKEGFTPLVPKYDDMSGVAENPIPNPERYRFVEFPIYNCLVYFLYLVNGGVDEKLARFVSIIFSLGSIIILFQIVRKYWDDLNSLLATAIFAFLPFNVFYSRTILPESPLLFFSLGMFYFTSLWIEKESRKLLTLSIIFTTCALLTKPFAAIYLLPIFYLIFKKEGRIWPLKKEYFLWLGVSLLPVIFWRIWMLQYPTGIPSSSWLFNGNGIRLKPAFFKWILADRFGREILSIAGTILFFIGVLKKFTPKEGPLFHLLALSSALYLVIVATGNVQHDYYQLLITPILAIFLARGFILLLKGGDGFLPRVFTAPIAIVFLFLTFYLTIPEILGLYQVNNWSIVEAGKEADQILPKNAVVIAPYNGDTAFLYQINRPGWPFQFYPLEWMILYFKTTHFVSVNFDDQTNYAMKNYQVVKKTDKFVIVDLREELKD